MFVSNVLGSGAPHGRHPEYMSGGRLTLNYARAFHILMLADVDHVDCQSP